MTFSATAHRTDGTDLWLEARGPVPGTAAADLEALIIGAIVVRLPETLLTDLRHVTALSLTGAAHPQVAARRDEGKDGARPASR